MHKFKVEYPNPTYNGYEGGQTAINTVEADTCMVSSSGVLMFKMKGGALVAAFSDWDVVIRMEETTEESGT